jgi:hypothetical protein
MATIHVGRAYRADASTPHVVFVRGLLFDIPAVLGLWAKAWGRDVLRRLLVLLLRLVHHVLVYHLLSLHLLLLLLDRLGTLRRSLAGLGRRAEFVETVRTRTQVGALVETALVAHDLTRVKRRAAPRRRLGSVAVEAAAAQVLRLLGSSIVCVHDGNPAGVGHVSGTGRGWHRLGGRRRAGLLGPVVLVTADHGRGRGLHLDIVWVTVRVSMRVRVVRVLVVRMRVVMMTVLLLVLLVLDVLRVFHGTGVEVGWVSRQRLCRVVHGKGLGVDWAVVARRRVVDSLVALYVRVRSAAVPVLLVRGSRGRRGKVVHRGRRLGRRVADAAAKLPVCPEDAARRREVHAGAVERLVASTVSSILVVVHVCEERVCAPGERNGAGGREGGVGYGRPEGNVSVLLVVLLLVVEEHRGRRREVAGRREHGLDAAGGRVGPAVRRRGAGTGGV